MAALALVREIEQDLKAEYAGVVVKRTYDEEMDSIGTMDVHPVYIKAVQPDRVRIFLRMGRITPYIHPPLVPARDRPNTVNIKVHPEEPLLNLHHDGIFMRLSVDRAIYIRYKQRFMRLLRFVLDAEKMEVEGFGDFMTECNSMVRGD